MWIIVATPCFLLGATAYVCSRRRAAAAAASSLRAPANITCSQALLSDCFSWQRAPTTHGGVFSSSSSSSLRLGRRRLFGHRLAVEEGVALSGRGEVDAARLQLLLVDGNFTSEHYELLSRLDEDMPSSLGATQAELDRFPTYVVDNGGEQHQCFVCLASFEKGDVVRILPCLHQFHQEGCCDPWLKIKMECPVCRILF